MHRSGLKKETIPYTLEHFYEEKDLERRSELLEAAGVGTILTFIISSLMYLFGLIVNWVRLGDFN
jgi:hypothetical protein